MSLLIYHYLIVYWYPKAKQATLTRPIRQSADEKSFVFVISNEGLYNKPKLRDLMKSYFVYILSNKYHTVFYTGMTNDLNRRIYEHRNKLVDGFTKKYNTTKLLYFEETTNVNNAIAREKQIKDWRRGKKL